MWCTGRPTPARTALELGGKSPAILLEDVDLDAAMASLLIGACTNGGQVCMTLSRILAPRARYEEVVAAFAGVYRATTVGDPFDPNTQQGPQATKRAFGRCQYYVGRARGGRRNGRRWAVPPEGIESAALRSAADLRRVAPLLRVPQRPIVLDWKVNPLSCAAS